MSSEAPILATWRDQDNSALADKRILIVEDEPIVAVDYRFQLMEMGASPVGHKSTIRATLEFLATNELDAAIVDYRLADGTSEPVMEWLRAHGIPFIVITANTPEMRQWNGAACTLDKPVSPPDLRAALSSILSRGT